MNHTPLHRLDEIMTYNKQFVEDKKYEAYVTSKLPDKKIVILSCMDTRLTELLPKAMNIKNGDAKIIKNAGATIMHPFGSIVRSILVAIYEFEAQDVMIVGHEGCGMSHLNHESIMGKMVDRGIKQETIETLRYAGVEVDKWLEGFGSVEEAVKESVRGLTQHPLIPKDVFIHGLIMNPKTGALRVVINGYD